MPVLVLLLRMETSIRTILFQSSVSLVIKDVGFFIPEYVKYNNYNARSCIFVCLCIYFGGGDGEVMLFRLYINYVKLFNSQESLTKNNCGLRTTHILYLVSKLSRQKKKKNNTSPEVFHKVH